MASENHPVWTVYDRLRSARLSVKYYGARLQKFERLNLALEIVLLVAAPSSAIAGLWFWDSPAGHVIWQGVTVIAAVVAVIKVPLGMTKTIKEYESVLSGYRTLEFDLMEIKAGIEQRQKYDASLQADFKKAQQREKALVGRTPEATVKDSVRKICEAEVQRELPAEAFFVPQA